MLFHDFYLSFLKVFKKRKKIDIFCNKTHFILQLLYRLIGSLCKTKPQYRLLMILFFLHLETFYYNILGTVSWWLINYSQL